MKITVKRIPQASNTNPSWLPEGYSTTPPPGAVVLGADAPGYREYGGADRSKATDGANIRHKALCAWKDKRLLRPDEQEFGFRMFREDPITKVWSEVIYWGSGHVFCSGRGEINVQGGWIAGLPDGSDDDGEIPGWVPIPNSQPPTPNSLAYVPLTPNRYSAALDGQAVSGGRSLDMASLFDLPSDARAYCVRLVAQADRPDVRARLGSEQQPGLLTANTQAAGLQIHQIGIVNAGEGGRVWLSVAPTGATAQVWLQVAGYWPGG